MGRAPGAREAINFKPAASCEWAIQRSNVSY
jgi:hypothetical protein